MDIIRITILNVVFEVNNSIFEIIFILLGCDTFFNSVNTKIHRLISGELLENGTIPIIFVFKYS